MYPFVLKESVFRAIGYFIKLILLCSVVLSIYLMTLVSEFYESGIKDFEKKVPYFSIESGMFYSSGETEQNINSHVTLVIKDDYAENVTIDGLSENRIYLIATKDKLLIRSRGVSAEESPKISYKDIGDTDKETLLNDVKNAYNSITGKISIYIVIFAFVITYLLITKFFLIIMYMFVLLIFNMLFGASLKFRDYFKLSAYIATLPIILEVFAICIGGKYSTTADFITFLIAVVYAFYALRAIRLNDIYLNASGATPEERIINAIKSAQNELEKQLEEIEKEEEEKKKLKEEKKNKRENSAEEDKDESKEENSAEEDKDESKEEHSNNEEVEKIEEDNKNE